MGRVRSRSPEILDFLKKTNLKISNPFSSTFSDFISDARVTDHRRYDR